MLNIIYQYRVARADIVANPGLVYVFGDNVARYGYAGQAAACRSLPNAHGIATLWEPGKYFDDRDYQKITAILIEDIDSLLDFADGAPIVFPLDGIGTGLARMEQEAPACYDFMCGYLELKLGIINNMSALLQRRGKVYSSPSPQKDTADAGT
jgi:hypothetical protein